MLRSAEKANRIINIALLLKVGLKAFKGK